MLLFISSRASVLCHVDFDFNTSHVVIYPEYRFGAASIFWFQYISCCYLSYLPVVKNSGNASFNTSHVVIYRRSIASFKFFLMFQYISCCYLSKILSIMTCQKLSFNTSHVVIYPRWTGQENICKPVSIHLMLLFIEISGDLTNFLTWFQYISCCYLSKKLVLHCKKFARFNTSHVVIYPMCKLSSL